MQGSSYEEGERCSHGCSRDCGSSRSARCRVALGGGTMKGGVGVRAGCDAGLRTVLFPSCVDLGVVDWSVDGRVLVSGPCWPLMGCLDPLLR